MIPDKANDQSNDDCSINFTQNRSNRRLTDATDSGSANPGCCKPSPITGQLWTAKFALGGNLLPLYTTKKSNSVALPGEYVGN